MPRLTVLLSTYCRPARLKIAARSILGQTFEDLELVILDDNSPNPEQLTAIHDLCEEDPRCRAILGEATPEYKQGVCTFGQLLNRGIAETDSEFYSFFCDSAEMYPQRCERLAAHLDATPECQIVWGQQSYYRYDAHGLLAAAAERPEIPDKHEVWQGPGWVARLENANQVDHSSTMERRSVTLPWSEDVEAWFKIDWERWLRMARAGTRFDMVGWLGEIKRVHVDSSGWLHDANGKTLAEVIALRSK